MQRRPAARRGYCTTCESLSLRLGAEDHAPDAMAGVKCKPLREPAVLRFDQPQKLTCRNSSAAMQCAKRRKRRADETPNRDCNRTLPHGCTCVAGASLRLRPVRVVAGGGATGVSTDALTPAGGRDLHGVALRLVRRAAPSAGSARRLDAFELHAGQSQVAASGLQHQVQGHPRMARDRAQQQVVVGGADAGFGARRAQAQGA